MSVTTTERAAAAELVETLVSESADSVENVVRGLVRGGVLEGFCTEEELAGWHRTWKRRERAAERWQRGEIPVDPALLEQQAEGKAAAEFEEEEMTVAAEAAALAALKGETKGIAGGVLRMIDRRLLRERVKWQEVNRALLYGEKRAEVRRGAGCATQADGKVVEWVGFAVVILTAEGAVSRVFPECRYRGMKKPGWKGMVYGVVRMQRPVVVERAVDGTGRTQAMGTLLIMFRGRAGQCRTHADLAAVCGTTRANGSAKARRIAAEDVKAGGKAAFRVLRSRETVGKPKNKTKGENS
jgi:hypothetical protein